jgi:hypothetical protein
MAVEDEMAPGLGAIVAANDIRHLGMGRDDAVGQASPFQELANEFGGVARVAGGIGTTVLDESLQEVHEIIAVAIDPFEQLSTPRVHAFLPLIIDPTQRQPPGHAFSRGGPRHRLCPSGLASDGLFLRPQSPMLADSAISVILLKAQVSRRLSGGRAGSGTGAASRP